MRLRERWLRLPMLIRFLAIHAANGMAIGSSMLLLASWFDVAGIGTLLAKDETGLATFLLYAQNALTFGSVSMGVAVMNLGE